MRTLAFSILTGTLIAAAALPACHKNWKITRKDPASVKDYDYRFDEDDAREVANYIRQDCMTRPWIDRWKAAHHGQDPLIVLGNVQNKTEDYVPTTLFTDVIQKEMINSGRVRVKAEKDLRAELRDERLDTEFNDPATVKEVAREVNADYMLVGKVVDNTERRRDEKALIKYYKVTMELIDLESAEKVWIGDHDIEKRAVR